MCRCGRRMNTRGLHGFSCKFSAGRHPRHATLNDIIKRGQQSARVPSILKPVGVDREMARDRILFPCSHSPTGEVCAGIPPVPIPMPKTTSIAGPYQ